MAGISNATVAQIDLAQEILGGRLVSVQNEFSPRFRSSEGELEHCEKIGVAFIPWSPLGGIGRIDKMTARLPGLRRGGGGSGCHRAAGHPGLDAGQGLPGHPHPRQQPARHGHRIGGGGRSHPERRAGRSPRRRLSESDPARVPATPGDDQRPSAGPDLAAARCAGWATPSSTTRSTTTCSTRSRRRCTSCCRKLKRGRAAPHAAGPRARRLRLAPSHRRQRHRAGIEQHLLRQLRLRAGPTPWASAPKLALGTKRPSSPSPWAPPSRAPRGGPTGAIVAALIDEAMGFALSASGITAFTGRLTLTYRAPTPVGRPARGARPGGPPAGPQAHHHRRTAVRRNPVGRGRGPVHRRRRRPLPGSGAGGGTLRGVIGVGLSAARQEKRARNASCDRCPTH